MNHYYLPLKFDPENNYVWMFEIALNALVFGSMQLWPFTSYKMS